MNMINTEYLYLGGPLDGQWRVPPGVIDRPLPEHYAAPGTDDTVTYVPTKFGQMGDGGELRITCYVMIELELRRVLTDFNHESAAAGYRKRLERALMHQSLRMHMQRIWRVPEVLDFGPAWLAMERRPVPLEQRPSRDNPQA
jgi:hypothetical protein